MPCAFPANCARSSTRIHAASAWPWNWKRSWPGADLTELAGHLGGVLEGPRRMTRIIGSLKKSAERPSLMRYALGQDVLKLEDDSHD